ncbi:hypothetical protein PIB30_097197, partial [Stylosanthes scabra]|nr:hypothetical protein [Stylosanthes scabra]
MSDTWTHQFKELFVLRRSILNNNNMSKCLYLITKNVLVAIVVRKITPKETVLKDVAAVIAAATPSGAIDPSTPPFATVSVQVNAPNSNLPPIAANEGYVEVDMSQPIMSQTGNSQQ